MNEDVESALSPSPLKSIIFGGLAVGVLDMLDALIFFGWYLDVGIQRVFQSVAAGVLGREAAVGGGWNTWMLGVFLHFVVAFIIASVYTLASRFLPVLLRHPVICGLAYGVVCHFVMQCIVIPFSAIGRWPTFPLLITLNGVIGHALLVGLPVAMINRWAASRTIPPNGLS